MHAEGANGFKEMLIADTAFIQSEWIDMQHPRPEENEGGALL